MEDIFKNVYEIHYNIKDTQEFGSLNLKWLHLLRKKRYRIDKKNSVYTSEIN